MLLLTFNFCSPTSFSDLGIGGSPSDINPICVDAVLQVFVLDDKRRRVGRNNSICHSCLLLVWALVIEKYLLWALTLQALISILKAKEVFMCCTSKKNREEKKA